MEPKCRVWDKTTKQMLSVVGSLRWGSDGNLLSIQASNSQNWLADGWWDLLAANCVVMWWTGLLDRNGKEIYESDLLTSQITYIWEDSDIEVHPCEVVWMDDRACWGLLKENRKLSLPSVLAGWLPTVFEVVGNQFEHPELLKAARP